MLIPTTSLKGRFYAHMLEIKNLTKIYEGGVKALDNVSFSVEPGEFLAVIGLSGSGKSTLLRCINRLIEPTDGKIIWDGVDVTAANQSEMRLVRRKIGMVFQHFNLVNRSKVITNVLTGRLGYVNPALSMFNRFPASDIEGAMKQLDRIGIADQADKRADELSGGQQQRVGIARAIATNPDLVVLDEPTSMLDLSVRAEIIDLLTALQEEFKLAFLFISHDLTTVEYICHRVAVMYLSQVVEFGTVKQVFETPQHPYSRALLSSALPVDPKVKRSSYIMEGEIPSPVNLPLGCYLASRCPEVKPECREQPQVLQEVGDGRQVRCWRVVKGDIPEWNHAGATLTQVIS